MESPSELEDYDFDDSIMLPPTTSTYNPHTRHLPPAPDADVLRRRLRDSLGVTKKAWERAGKVPKDSEGFEGFQELQGTELCEIGTAAIRAAKTYYYTTDISLLSSKDDKTLREEFLAVLDVLKRMAQRKFEGGVRPEERDAVISWITGVESALQEEEKAIVELRRKGRDWLEGSWDGREYGMLQCPAYPTSSFLLQHLLICYPFRSLLFISSIFRLLRDTLAPAFINRNSRNPPHALPESIAVRPPSYPNPQRCCTAVKAAIRPDPNISH
jgi:hypothetical protein